MTVLHDLGGIQAQFMVNPMHSLKSVSFFFRFPVPQKGEQDQIVRFLDWKKSILK